MPVTTNGFYGRLIETFSKPFNCISALVYHVFLKQNYLFLITYSVC